MHRPGFRFRQPAGNAGGDAATRGSFHPHRIPIDFFPMTRTLLRLAVFFAAATPAVVLAQATPATQPLDGIVAVVDDGVILQSELDRMVATVTANYKSNPQQLPPHDVLERQVLERLIMDKLQLARAADTGIKASDTEIDEAVGRIAKQNNLTVDQLRDELAKQGMSYTQFRDNIRDQIILQQMRNRYVQGRVQVSDAEVDSLLKHGNLNAGQLRLGHILISVPEGATPAQIDAAKAKAEDVKRQIDGGMDFAAAAIRYSDAQNALEGGDLGWRGYDALPQAFTEIASRLEPGQVAGPIRGPNGFHIIKLIGKRAQPTQVVEEYHALHILVKTSELVPDAQAEKKIDELYREIQGGADFEKLAKADSDDGATANLGGDMGWFAADAYGPAVDDALKGLKDGQVSQPFRTEVGWHLIKLLGTRQTDKTQQAERDRARNLLFQRKAEDEYESFLRQLRGEAYVRIRLPGVAAADAKPAS